MLRALARSAQLVRPRFWLTARIVTIPLLLEAAALHSLQVAGLPHPFLAGAAYESARGVTVGALIGLAEATFAIDLMSEPSQMLDTLADRPNRPPTSASGLGWGARQSITHTG